MAAIGIITAVLIGLLWLVIKAHEDEENEGFEKLYSFVNIAVIFLKSILLLTVSYLSFTYLPRLVGREVPQYLIIVATIWVTYDYFKTRYYEYILFDGEQTLTEYMYKLNDDTKKTDSSEK